MDLVDLAEGYGVKTLGIGCGLQPSLDVFKSHANLPPLRIITIIFDPLGFLALTIVLRKSMFQQLLPTETADMFAKFTNMTGIIGGI